MAEPENRLRNIYSQVLEIDDPQQRLAFLSEVCGTDSALRQQIEELIRADGEAGNFLPEQPAPHVAGKSPKQGIEESFDSGLRPSSTIETGDRIGRYKLLQKIGEGGCGMVYMAEQEQPVRRKVALKVIKLGMDTKQVIARFEAERQALALMDHPNIAKVLDAGATDAGRPFFVMELVRGVKITQYCDEQKCSTKVRLELLVQVCQAVQHAHQKGIIHRDLKPSNILVTERDGQPVPKVIDFGIAKATGDLQLTEKTLFTAFEQFLGTPAYMSPEQATFGELDIDTRSDIYSLGVLLYELLTGKTPFDTQALLASGLDEMRRIIREKEPVKPSTRLRVAPRNELTTTAQCRHTEPLKLVLMLKGDLDWIVMKCLEKDRRRRYETVNGLAMDIQRHLNDEPVLASPPSRLYEFQKSLRRHRVGFAATGAVIVALMAGVMVSTMEAVRAWRAEREQAHLRQQAQQAQTGEEQQRRQAEAQEVKALKNLYAADMAVAYQALERGNLGHVRQLLTKYDPNSAAHSSVTAGLDPRGWEWRNLWQRSRGDESAILYGHSNVITIAVMLADGRTVVSASWDRTLRFWDVPTRKALEVLPLPEPARCAAVSPDRRLLALGGQSGYWSVWDPVSRELRFEATNSSPVRGMAFSPDNSLLALATPKAVEVWKLSDSKMVSTVSRPNGNNWRTGLTFSPDGKLVAYSQGEGILDTNSLMLCDWANRTSSVLGSCQVGHAVGLAFSHDGRTVVSGEPTGIWLWDTSTHRLIKRLTEQHESIAQGVAGIALSPNGNLMASGSDDQTIRLWETGTWQEKRVLRGHEHAVHSVAFSPDGTKLISCGIDETIRIWEVEAPPTHRETYRTPDDWFLMPAIPNAPRQVRVQMGTGDSSGIGFLDLVRCEEESTQVSPITLAPGQLPDSVSGNLTNLAILRTNGSVEIWNTAPIQRVKALFRPANRVRGVALSGTGQLLAIELDDGAIELVDVEQEKTLTTLGPAQVIGGAPGFGQYFPRLTFWSQDTRFVRLFRNLPDQAELVEILLMPGKETRRIRPNHKDHIGNFCMSNDGEMLATCAFDGQIKLWSVLSGAEIHTLRGQFVGYVSVAISPDGSRLAAGAPDGTVTMWDTSSWSQVAHWKAHTSTTPRVCFLEGGDILMTRGLFGTRWENSSADFITHIWRPPSFAEINAIERSQAPTR